MNHAPPKLGFGRFHFHKVDSIGFSGIIWILWHSNCITVDIISFFFFFFFGMIKIKACMPLWFVNVSSSSPQWLIIFDYLCGTTDCYELGLLGFLKRFLGPVLSSLIIMGSLMDSYKGQNDPLPLIFEIFGPKTLFGK